jgi:hypothetical protein
MEDRGVDDDWRLDRGQDEYLRGATVVRKRYRAWSVTWDHDHCQFCWAKFVDPESSEAHGRLAREDPEILTEGYATLGTGPEGQDDYHWICDRCFADFRERFAWHIGAAPD